MIDPLGRRIGKKVNGVRRWGLLYKDALEPVAELSASNSVVSRFIYATKAHVPDFMVKGSVTYRIVSDHLGSVRFVVNTSTGAIVQRLEYDEFGSVLSDTNPGFQPFGFAGGLYDADTGLVRFGARDYDAVTGRWTAKDPIGFGGGQANLFLYVGGDPVNRVDPTGNAWVLAPCAIGAALGVVGALNFSGGKVLGHALRDFMDRGNECGDPEDPRPSENELIAAVIAGCVSGL